MNYVRATFDCILIALILYDFIDGVLGSDNDHFRPNQHRAMLALNSARITISPDLEEVRHDITLRRFDIFKKYVVLMRVVLPPLVHHLDVESSRETVTRFVRFPTSRDSVDPRDCLQVRTTFQRLHRWLIVLLDTLACGEVRNKHSIGHCFQVLISQSLSCLRPDGDFFVPLLLRTQRNLSRLNEDVAVLRTVRSVLFCCPSCDLDSSASSNELPNAAKRSRRIEIDIPLQVRGPSGSPFITDHNVSTLCRTTPYAFAVIVSRVVDGEAPGS